MSNTYHGHPFLLGISEGEFKSALGDNLPRRETGEEITLDEIQKQSKLLHVSDGKYMIIFKDKVVYNKDKSPYLLDLSAFDSCYEAYRVLCKLTEKDYKKCLGDNLPHRPDASEELTLDDLLTRSRVVHVSDGKYMINFEGDIVNDKDGLPYLLDVQKISRRNVFMNIGGLW